MRKPPTKHRRKESPKKRQKKGAVPHRRFHRKVKKKVPVSEALTRVEELYQYRLLLPATPGSNTRIREMRGEVLEVDRYLLQTSGRREVVGTPHP